MTFYMSTCFPCLFPPMVNFKMPPATSYSNSSGNKPIKVLQSVLGKQ